VYLVLIDAHLHLWNTGRLRYGWLQRPENALSTPAGDAGRAGR
jgi:predicted TIM-barrel fold metal-dependent hydrolase